MKPRPNIPPPASRAPSGHKWFFRIAAALLMPLLALSLLEAALRLAGYGYQTSLFEKITIKGRGYLVNNDNFSLRFFPADVSRWPSPVMMEAVKPPGTCRIFILGESAALGDPSPPAAASRYLEVLLRERYPGVNFEVINVAITAINSHVIVPMARECARYQGDLWIIYMGNNEMIGPFGAATLFGAKAPPWPLVRLNLALRTTRLGQLAADLARQLRSKLRGPSESGGLEMFLGNQLAPDNPLKEAVYKNFQRNLRDIIQAGHDAGAAILLNTVAVNLKDCPPFASLHTGGLSPTEREKCDRLCAGGRRAQTNGDLKLAAASFAQAATLDPQFAETQFRLGQCLLHLNKAGAASDFQKACDCDALPFRADSRINGIIRQAARQTGGPDLVLCDAAASLPEPGSVPGEETFYEHVHFKCDGNYRLAMLWAPLVQRLLPAAVQSKAQGDWLSQEMCEARLGMTDWNRQSVLISMRQRLEQPPFNAQFNNAQRVSDLTAWINQLSGQMTSAAAANARALYNDAMARAPRDYFLRELYTEFLELTGDWKQDALEWKQARELMPRNPFACMAEGKALEQLQEWGLARDAFRQVVCFHPRYPLAWFELGQLAVREGNMEEAVKNYRQAVRLQPRFVMGRLNLGIALLQCNQRAAAREQFSETLRLDPANPSARQYLAATGK